MILPEDYLVIKEEVRESIILELTDTVTRDIVMRYYTYVSIRWKIKSQIKDLIRDIISIESEVNIV